MEKREFCMQQASGLLQWAKICCLYRKAFPRDERKPFSIICSMRKKGKTDVWYFSEKGKFAGFATTINSDELILLDYLAVPEALQGRGIGAKMLESLKKTYTGRGIFVEIESTREGMDNLPEKIRRKRFYERAGFREMCVEAVVFGVEMELLGLNCKLDFDGYKAFYRDEYNPWAAEHICKVE